MIEDLPRRSFVDDNANYGMQPTPVLQQMLPPQPSSMHPQNLGGHRSGKQLPHWFAGPQIKGAVHVPQCSVPPQPSGAGPH